MFSGVSCLVGGVVGDLVEGGGKGGVLFMGVFQGVRVGGLGSLRGWHE